MTRSPDSQHEMVTFFTTVQTGSFAQAALKLGQTPSAVSKTISRLETRLNVKLFNRSTRRIRTTEVGERYYHHCKQILSDIKVAEEDVQQFSSQYTGKINVNCGAGFAMHHVAALISEFLTHYPNIKFNLSTSTKTNFFEDEIDLSFEFKTPEDSSLVTRKIGDCPWTICTTPAYVEKFGMPQKPEELKQHNCCVMVGVEGDAYDNWEFEEELRHFSVKVEGNFYAAAFLIQKALVNGVGIARLPNYMVAGDIESGILIPLFTDLQSNNGREIYVAYPHRAQTKKVKAFIDFTINRLPKRIL